MRATATLDREAGVAELPVITLAQPLPGFPDEAGFALERLDEDGTLCRLRSLAHEGTQFLVVPAAQFHPEYAPEVGDELVAALEIEAESDVLVLLIVHAGRTLADTTVNLRAPLLVNVRTCRAAQVILDDPALGLAAPLVA
jgi:flagellar assembly factor FliW